MMSQQPNPGASMETVDKQPAPDLAHRMRALTDHLVFEFLGGSKIWKFATVINIQKGGTFVFLGALMLLYGNTSTPAWVYLALHGSYGLCWLLKHFAFRDPQWEQRCTIGGGLMAFAAVLGPYWLIGWLLISGTVTPTYPLPDNAWLMLCVTLHTLGVAIMFAADCQKHYTLQYRRGLIDTGMFRYIRHPNYLGEMMIYGTYALLVDHWLPWLILAWVWIGIFLVNMLLKEESLSRYPAWRDYKARTGMLLPKLTG